MTTKGQMRPTIRMNLTASQAGENSQCNVPKHTIVSGFLTDLILRRNCGRRAAYLNPLFKVIVEPVKQPNTWDAFQNSKSIQEHHKHQHKILIFEFLGLKAKQLFQSTIFTNQKSRLKIHESTASISNVKSTLPGTKPLTKRIRRCYPEIQNISIPAPAGIEPMSTDSQLVTLTTKPWFPIHLPKRTLYVSSHLATLTRFLHVGLSWLISPPPILENWAKYLKSG